MAGGGFFWGGPAALIYPAKLLLRKIFTGALVAAEQISQAAVFLAALLRCSLLLFPKNSLRDFFESPVYPEKLADAIFSGTLSYKSNPARRVALRCGTQFVPYGYLMFLE